MEFVILELFFVIERYLENEIILIVIKIEILISVKKIVYNIVFKFI